MSLPTADSGNDTKTADLMSHDDSVASAPNPRGQDNSTTTKSLKRTLSYKDEDEDEAANNQEVGEGETALKKLKQEEDDVSTESLKSNGGEQKHDEEGQEKEDEEELDYEAQRQRNILENQRILAELGLDNGPLTAGLMPFSSRGSMTRPPPSSMHGHRRGRPPKKSGVGSDEEYVDQEEGEDGSGRVGGRRPGKSSTKLKLLQDVQPVQLRQSMRLRGLKPQETKEILSDHTDGEEEFTDDSDNESRNSKKSRRGKKYEEKQWKTRNNGVQDVLPSEQKLVARSAWRGRKQLTGFMIEVELPNNISTPLTLRSIATTIWDLGEIYKGSSNKLSYWSGNGSLYKHPYPVGFKAEKQYFRNTFSMEILETSNGPEFVVRNMDNGQTFRGASPTQPWTKACLASHSKGTRISGPLFFGFSDPLLQKMIEGLEGYQRWSSVCAEVEREKLGLLPLPPPSTSAKAPLDPAEEKTENHEKEDTTNSAQPSSSSDKKLHEGSSGGEATETQTTDPPSQEPISKEE
ncbi:hypothetical protein BGW41_004114 [Actinomortierella wolfii]|nr:hypothetical protein BGW41_004114 [Actinomortierella wolfii]